MPAFTTDPTDFATWKQPEIASQILCEDPATTTADQVIPLPWIQVCAGRVRKLRDFMRGQWIGLTDEFGHPLLDWLVACGMSQEHSLLLGPPGTAKSEIAISFFKMMGLNAPNPTASTTTVLRRRNMTIADRYHEWEQRALEERKQQKFFHYLLGKFTQQEELFGPIDIDLLRQGVLVRVNYGLLTAPGVRGAFIDELFKGSSSIVNTMLTVTQERTYFQWGGQVRADLAMLIGASNEMPGGLTAAGGAGISSGGEDFTNLYAFIDRFPIRLVIPGASGTAPCRDAKQPANTDRTQLEAAFDLAIAREARRLNKGALFNPQQFGQDVCMNDLLLLSRAIMQQEAGVANAPKIFPEARLKSFRKAFVKIAGALQERNTQTGVGQISWTISVRKLRSLYKIALAHAMLNDDTFAQQGSTSVGALGIEQHRVFAHIWDSPLARTELQTRLTGAIHDYAM